ncbi:fimbria/pilus outer membrane usher protein [Polaromonas jejuensis]|uniref:Fimbria/pilus outer membrane usher protein n=1 Tax=Polaromonas jejuensis TaxID=457502 RepID=A0ABW0Q8S1_9BURK|nr:fimbria/pilus outer membrane usher protein [Polaromonas jejuensis]
MAQAQTAPASSPPAPARGANDRLLPLDVFINSTKGGVWTLLERNGVLYAPADAFEEWRLNHQPSAQDIQFQGQPWYPLSAIPGFEARLNFANQSVDLVFSPSAFNAVRLTQEATLRPPLSPTIPAAFANYDLNYTISRSRNPGGVADARDLGALTELGLSGQWGLLTSSYVGRNLISQDPSLSASWRRLETTYTRNFLDTTSTLRLGDSTTRTGISGRSVYFGGVQFAKNFSLQPGFITRPIPTVTGLSAAPSTVELYVNDALRQTSKVPSGPFSIDNFPALTGSGEARVVVRDILGRETIITQPFFSNANLLEANLNDWSFELGAIRNNLGTDNANYGPRFVSGLWRKGLSQSLTAEVNGEWSKTLKRGGLGASYGLPLQMLGQTALSVSHSDTGGSGGNWLVGVERSGMRHGVSFSAQGASRGYRQLGIDTQSPLPRLQTTASYSYSSDDFGAFNLSHASFDNYDTGRLNTLNLSYTVRLGVRSALTLSATRLSGTTSGTSIGAFLIVPLENRITVASGVTTRSGTTESYVNASRALSAETGWGWRTALGSRAESAYAEGGAYYQGTKGLFSADVSDTKSQQNVRLGLIGGLVAAEGQVFATRRVQDSFAIVEVPGYANVGVGFQGSTLTRTNADGVALLPRLLPFQRNSVRLDPTELPISAELDSIEQEAVPAQRSAVKITFPVRSGRGALIRIVFDDGEPAPAGAEIELVGDKKEFFVARRGEAFVTGLQTVNRLRLKWNGASCMFNVELPPGNLEDITRVGPVRCQGVKQ